MNRFILFLLFSFLNFLLQAAEHKELAKYPLRAECERQFVLLSMPKSGTHLVMKFWYLLTGQDGDYGYSAPAKGCFSFCHFDIPATNLNRLLKNPKCQVVLNIRDPRDVCLSMREHLANRPNDWLKEPELSQFRKMSFDNQLLYVIRSNGRGCPMSYLDRLIRTMRDSRIIVCRYEYLVGPQGGGREDEQHDQIELLLKAFKAELTESELIALKKDVYGVNVTKEFTNTFRQGQIGNWRHHFKPEHIRLCKQMMGKQLIELGYEKDLNW